VHLVVAVPLGHPAHEARLVLVLVDAAVAGAHLLHHRGVLVRRDHESIHVRYLHDVLHDHRHGSPPSFAANLLASFARAAAENRDDWRDDVWMSIARDLKP